MDRRDMSTILATIDPEAAEYRACVGILPRLPRPMLVSHMVVADVDCLLTTRFGISTANRSLADVARGALARGSLSTATPGTSTMWSR